jgi:hypothetical protein
MSTSCRVGKGCTDAAEYATTVRARTALLETVPWARTPGDAAGIDSAFGSSES